MPSDPFIDELKRLTVGEWQSILLRAADLFPGGVKAAYDVAMKTYGAALPQEGGSSEPPLLMQIGAFLKDVGEPPPMLVERIIPDKSLILLTGKPKAGKSLAAIDLMDSVCQGKQVWDTFGVNRPGPVVYFGMEDGKYEIANRLLARGIRVGDERPLWICYHRFNLSRPDAMLGMRKLIADSEIEPVLVVIDTAREALGISDWSNSAEVTEKVRPIRDFAREVCSVLMVAHNRKAEALDSGDEIAGTNAFTGAVDGWISAWKKEKTKELHRLYLRAEGRGGMREEFILDMDLQTLHWRALTEDEMEDEKRRAQKDERDQKFLAVSTTVEGRGGKATVAQIAEDMGTEIRNTQTLIREMCEFGLLVPTGEKYQSPGAGRPAPIYTTTSKISALANKREPYRDSNPGDLIPTPLKEGPVGKFFSTMNGADEDPPGFDPFRDAP